jgi:hypothetical protein
MNNTVDHDWSARVLVISATDAQFFGGLQSMLATLHAGGAHSRPDVAIFDIGMNQAQRDWLKNLPALVVQPHGHFGINPERHPPAQLSFVARPFLREYFPDYDVYVWVDSDLWFQDAGVLDTYVAGALSNGFAITHESEHACRFQPWLQGWMAKHFLLGYGAIAGTWLWSRRHVNAGLFAGRANAPHWDEWARRYEAAIHRTGSLIPHDQFSLVQTVHAGAMGHARLRTTLLNPSCNWIVDRGVPMWNDASGAFCKPYPPYDPIRALHLAGPAKRRSYVVRRTGGGSFNTRVVPGASPLRPVVDPALGSASPVVADIAA